MSYELRGDCQIGISKMYWLRDFYFIIFYLLLTMHDEGGAPFLEDGENGIVKLMEANQLNTVRYFRS